MKNIARYITVTLLVLTGITTATAQDIFLPDDPGHPTQNHKLKIVSTEAHNIIIEVYNHNNNGTWFTTWSAYDNWTQSDANISLTLAEGDSIKIWNSTYSWSGWEYTYMEMDGKKIHENQHLASYGDNEMPTFVMPNHDATIYVYATFDPSTPGVEQADNPYCGMWNAETGELFVNNFVPYIPGYQTGYYGMGKDGYLLVGAINRAVYDYNISKADVRILTVSGEMGHGNDNIALENVHTLDLRHTYGYKSYYGLWYDNKTWYDNIFDQYVFSSALRRLILPSNIQGLSDGAFEGWNGEWKLEELTCYAVTPPMVNDNTLTPLPSTCVLCVPEQSVAAYKADKNWSRFATIKGIQEAEDVTVDLPDNFTDGRYRGMSLELLNAENGESRKYIIDERGQYVYRGLVSGARYTALLRSPKNGIIAQTDTMLLDNNPLEMTFPHVVGMDEVQISVKAGDQDVTNDIAISWTDRKGNRIGEGSKLEQQIAGSRIYYTLKLPVQLATRYQQPPATEHVVGTGGNSILANLLPLDSVTVSGVVRNAEGERLGGATVVVAQTVNGVISKSFVTTADAAGRYELKALAGLVKRSISAAGYITARQELTLSGEMPVDTVSLAPLSGAVITYGFTYAESVVKGEVAATAVQYSGYQNVGITAYNETTQQELTDISVQYPQVVISSGANKGDRIRLTATSLAAGFKPVAVTAVIGDDETAAVTIPIVQYGGIEASFEQTDNSQVTASLYDSHGRLYQTYGYDEATIRLTEIPDGVYTLVTMGGSTLFSRMLSLGDYAAVGLQEGRDYLSNEVTVTTGEIVVVANNTVPVIDESAFYYTDQDVTTFGINKSTVSAGSNVTLRTKIGFKVGYSEKVRNISLIVDLPDNGQMVEGSAMTGTKMVHSTVSEGRVTIPISTGDLDKNTRFVVMTTAAGDFRPTAYLQFDMDGRTVLQPIGTADCHVKGITINVPETICEYSVPVQGTAPARSFITVYAGDVEIGNTTTREDGTWLVRCETPPYPNLSNIPIRSKITTKQGLEIYSETAHVEYDQDYIRVDHVYLYHAGQMVDFDFNNPQTLEDQYLVTDLFSNGFTFAVEFNTTDAEKVRNVELYAKGLDGQWIVMSPEYHQPSGRWMVSNNKELNRGNPPVNVYVEYDANTERKEDGNVMKLTANAFDVIRRGIKEGDEDIEAKMNAIVNEHDQARQMELINEYFAECGIDADTPIEGSGKSLTEWIADADAYLNSSNNWDAKALDALDIYNANLGDNLKITHATGLSAQQLLSEGYEEMKMTTGGCLYQKVTSDRIVIVDLENDMKMEFLINESAMQAALAALRRGPTPEARRKFMDYVGDINTAVEVLQSVIDGVGVACGEVIKLFVNPQIAKCTDEIRSGRELLIAYSRAGTQVPQELSRHINDLRESRQFFEKVKTFFNNLAGNGPDIGDVISTFADAKLGSASGIVKGAVEQAKKINFGKFFAWSAIIADGVDAITKAQQILKVWDECPNPCKDDKANAARIENDIAGFFFGTLTFYVATLGADAYAIGSISSGTSTAAVGGPVSLAVTISGIVATCVKVWLTNEYNKQLEQKLGWWRKEISLLECDRSKVKERNMKIRADYLKDRSKFIKDLNAAIDPSGFVYEGVTDNRVENATATIYYKWEGEDEYGDYHNETVKWDAAEFGQQNPLFTDKEGKYQWDVPKGLWQVKVEKDGYETAYSDWLPVPPPQLDINIGIVQKSLPDVKMVRAYEDGIEVEFNKYMRPKTLDSSNIWLTQGSQKMGCTIEPLNEGKPWNSDSVYVSRLLLRPSAPLNVGTTIGLFVRRQVESYAGLQMQNDYEQQFTVMREIRELTVAPQIDVRQDGQRTFTITASPAQAAAGKTVSVDVSTSGFFSMAETAVFDEQGQAQLTVVGQMPGESVVNLTMAETSASAQTVIRVLGSGDASVAAPTASRISGTSVNAGETVTLSCSTEGAVVYYTLDGTCPCDENGTRQLYTGPISVNKEMEIRAYAVRGDDVSEVVSFHYYIVTAIHTSESSANRVPVAYYTVDGQRLSRPRKGLHVVRYSDGTTKKIMVK